MRWNEIVSEKLQHAKPLSARINPMTGMPDPKKAQSLIPPVPSPVDPGTAIQNALPQIAQVVGGASLQAVQMDDAQELQAMQQLAAAQQEPIGADTEEEIQRMQALSGQ
jgi:hypothetical protein